MKKLFTIIAILFSLSVFSQPYSIPIKVIHVTDSFRKALPIYTLVQCVDSAQIYQLLAAATATGTLATTAHKSTGGGGGSSTPEELFFGGSHYVWLDTNNTTDIATINIRPIFDENDENYSHNNAIGIFAGVGNSGKSTNSIGYYAGQNNTSDYQNAIGSQAGAGNSGTFQNAIGSGAGGQNTGVYQNAIGNNAGNGNTGDSVICIGTGAGVSNALDRSIFIGVGDSSNALIFGQNKNTVTEGRLKINGHTNIFGEINVSKLTEKTYTLGDSSIFATSTGYLYKSPISTIAWSLTGNSLSDSTTQFLGTTSNFPLVFKTNNIERGKINANGNLAWTNRIDIGTPLRTAAGTKLNINGEVTGKPLVIGNTAMSGSNTYTINGDISAKTYWYVTQGTSNNGGAVLTALGSTPGLSPATFYSVNNNATNTGAFFKYISLEGTGANTVQAIAATELHSRWVNNSTELLTLYGNGDATWTGANNVTLSMAANSAATSGNSLTISGGSSGAVTTQSTDGGMVVIGSGLTGNYGKSSLRFQTPDRGIRGTTSATLNPLRDRFLIASEKPLTNNSFVATTGDTLFSIPFGADSCVLGTFSYSIYMSDNDSAGCEAGNVSFACATNAGVSTSKTITPVFVQSIAKGTLTNTFSLAVDKTTAPDRLIVIVQAASTVHQAAGEGVKMTYTITNIGGRQGNVTQF